MQTLTCLYPCLFNSPYLIPWLIQTPPGGIHLGPQDQLLKARYDIPQEKTPTSFKMITPAIVIKINHHGAGVENNSVRSFSSIPMFL